MSEKNKITNPINKSLKNNVKMYSTQSRDVEKVKDMNFNGISIITVTNRITFLDNIFENYSRQNYQPKELIIILNKNEIDISSFKKKAKNHSNVKIYKVDEKKSLGYCLNYAVKKTKYEIVAKFDDDDYYSFNYLSKSVKAFDYTEAKLIGKRSHLVYFENSSLLAIRNPGHENCYDTFVNGSTMIFKKEIFKKVKFPNKSLAEDTEFCNTCVEKGIKIYSTDRFDHVYIRRKSKKGHAWKISDKKFLERSCEAIGKIDDYKKYSVNYQLN